MKKARSGILIEIAGWLFLFAGAGILYLVAQNGNSFIHVQAFAGCLFLVVIAGIAWEWLIAGKTPLNSRNAVLLGVLFWVLFDPLLMRQGLEEFSPDVLLRTLLYTLVFIVAVWLAYLMPPYRGIARFFLRMKLDSNHERIFWLVLTIYALAIVPVLVASGGGLTELWRSLLAGYSPDIDTGMRRGMLGDQQGFLQSVARLLQLAVPFLGITIIRARVAIWKRWVVLFMMLSLISIIFFSGERRVLALIVLGPALYLYLSLTEPAKKKWRLAFLAAALGLFWLMQAQVQFRSEGFYDFDAGVVETNPVEMHRDNNFYWFTTAVDTMPDTYNFTGEWIFAQVLVHPVPRFLWPGKPYTVGLPFVRWEDIGASLSISVIGELYVSQGLWGIILGGLVYGWLARNWDQLRQYMQSANMITVIYCLGLTLLLIGVRSFGDIVVNWYILGVVIFGSGYWGLFRGRSRRSRAMERSPVWYASRSV
ncbi:MAG: O-antigen polymerase [bacterium]